MQLVRNLVVVALFAPRRFWRNAIICATAAQTERAARGESNDDDNNSDSGGGDSDDGRNDNDDGGWSGEGNDDERHHCLHSNYDNRCTGRYFFDLLRGAALSEPMIREDVALRAVNAGSAVEFSPDEMEQLLQRCVADLRIMRSRGNVYFV